MNNENVQLPDHENVSSDEVMMAKENLLLMKQITDEKSLNAESSKKIYSEWIRIADRLKKGADMINDTRSRSTTEELEGNERYNKLIDLYAFLHTLLGYYDLFFQLNLTSEQHLKMQKNVLNIIRG